MNADVNAELSCHQCRDALVALTAGTLPTADRPAVERHLASCAGCRRERDAWHALGDAVRERVQRLPMDGGAARGLVRLRGALAFQHDALAIDEREDPSMADDSRFTARRAITAPRDAKHSSTAGVRRRRPYLAMLATAAVVLLSALVFGTLATRLHSNASPGATSSPTPTFTSMATPATEGALQTVPALPESASVVSISMVSAGDGWAAARVPNGDAVLLRYADGRWTPSGNSFGDTYLTDISMDSHDDGWAVGARGDQVTGVVLHYTGGSWTQVQTPNIEFAGARVWALSPSQALVLATLPKGMSGSTGSMLLRYDNGAWIEIASPRGISGATLLATDDLWATCWDGDILHYQGGQWTTYTISGLTPGQGGQPLSISMTSDTDGWLGGFTNFGPDGMFLAHFHAETWARVTGPAATNPTDINTIAMLPTGEAWAGGDAAGRETVLLQFVDGRWVATQPSYQGSIGEIVMVSPTEGWATVGGGVAAGLLHYQGGRWTPYDPGA